MFPNFSFLYPQQSLTQQPVVIQINKTNWQADEDSKLLGLITQYGVSGKWYYIIIII